MLGNIIFLKRPINMSNKKKVVTIAESELVDLIEGIANEAYKDKLAVKLAEEKKKWLAESKAKNTVLLERIEKLQNTVNQFLKG